MLGKYYLSWLFQSFREVHFIEYDIIINYMYNRMNEPLRQNQKHMKKINSSNNYSSQKHVKHKSKHDIEIKVKKTLSKNASRQNNVSAKESLANSIENLPLKNIKIQQTLKLEQEKHSNGYNQDSTASREQKNVKKKYSKPNGQYFGMRTSLSRQLPSKKKDNKQRQTSKLGFSKISKQNSRKSQQKSSSKSSRAEIKKSLSKKIRDYRALQETHRGQCQSLQHANGNELHRLRKLHSLQKMRAMQEIIHLQEQHGALKKSKK